MPGRHYFGMSFQKVLEGIGLFAFFFLLSVKILLQMEQTILFSNFNWDDKIICQLAKHPFPKRNQASFKSFYCDLFQLSSVLTTRQVLPKTFLLSPIHWGGCLFLAGFWNFFFKHFFFKMGENIVHAHREFFYHSIKIKKFYL